MGKPKLLILKARFIHHNTICNIGVIMVKNSKVRDYAKQNEAANALHETMLEYLRTKEKSCSSKSKKP